MIGILLSYPMGGGGGKGILEQVREDMLVCVTKKVTLLNQTTCK